MRTIILVAPKEGKHEITVLDSKVEKIEGFEKTLSENPENTFVKLNPSLSFYKFNTEEDYYKAVHLSGEMKL